MILQKFVSPCHSGTMHKHDRPGNRENQPTRNFTFNESKSLQYVKKQLHPRKSVHAKINLAKMISAKINLHVRNWSPFKTRKINFIIKQNLSMKILTER